MNKLVFSVLLKCYFRWASLLPFFYLLNPNVSSAQQSIAVSEKHFTIEVHPGEQLQVFKDTTGGFSFSEIIESNPFQKELQETEKPQGSYWTKFKLENILTNDVDVVIFFDRTSYVNFFDISNEKKVYQAKSGNGRKKSEMRPTDSRNHITIKLKANTPATTYYINYQNHTDYQPSLELRLIDINTFLKEQKEKHLKDFMFLGAMLILVVYSISQFIIYRYLPYFWLSLHALGLGVYSFYIKDYLIDLLFPDYPDIAPFLGVPMLIVGLIGMYQLVSVFLNLKKNHLTWYKVCRAICFLLIVHIFSYFIMVGVYNRYIFMFVVNILVFALSIPVFLTLLLSVWKKLNRSQKVFGYGILFFVATMILGVSFWLLISRNIVAVISSIGSLGQILFFAIALGIQMRQHEVDKNKALEKLNKFQKEENLRIELQVIERTQQIESQKIILEERNERIETLFKEVHHRVKNNLQLISSLLDMQHEWSSEQDSSRAIEDSRSRVVAMSMIHQFLYRTDQLKTINFETYTRELVQKLEELQPSQLSNSLSLNFQLDFSFDIDTAISLGLVLNELITNSFKHAISRETKVDIEISLKENPDRMLEMMYKDSGEQMGIPFQQAIKKGFGLRLASRLARQLQGDLSYQYGNGNVFILKFASEELRLELIDQE